MQKLRVIAASMLAACLIVLGGPSAAQHSANAPGHMQHSADTEIATLTALRAGGTVIFMRHERTDVTRSEEHTSELQSLMRISYAVFCLKKKNKHTYETYNKT